MNDKNFKHIIGLDFIRFIAAFIVLIYHYTFWIWAGSIYKEVREPFESLGILTKYGWIGVEIFFLLSGYVIALSAKDATAWIFFRSRVSRLVPAAWICAALTSGALLLYGTPFASILRSLLKTAIFWPWGGWVDYSYWTLGVEICFYALIFVTLYLNLFRYIEVIVSFVGVGSAIFWTYMLISYDQTGLNSLIYDNRNAQIILHYNTFFALGVIIFLCSTDKITVTRLITASVCVIGSLIEIYFHANYVAYFGIEHYNRGRLDFYSTLPPMLIFLAFFALICQSIRANNFLYTVFRRMLPSIRVMGLMTYPLYLLHQMLGYILIERLTPTTGAWWALIVAVAASLSLAMIVAVFGEPLVRRPLLFALDHLRLNAPHFARKAGGSHGRDRAR